MDPVTLAYYGAICGTLGLAGPRLGRPMRRLAVGVVVGLLAAGSLPLLRGVFGF